MTAPTLVAPARPNRTRTIGIVMVSMAAAIGIIQAASGYQDDGGTAAASSSSSSAQSAGDTTGRRARDGDFTFVIDKVSRASRVGTDVLSMKARGQFVLVNVTVTNHSDQAQSMFGANQYLFDRSGHRYSPDNEAGLYLGNAGSAYDEITPGTTMAGVVVFDVPKNVKPDRIELHDSAFSTGATVSLS